MNQNSSQANLIIASPDLADPNFAKSVILLVEHQINGAMGLILNYPTLLSLGSFARNQELEISDDLIHQPVYRGGPVHPGVGFILHTDHQLIEKEEVSPGLYISGGHQSLKYFLSSNNKNFRLIMGYAGWSEKQIEREMTEGSWLSAPLLIENIFSYDLEKMWIKTFNDMGVAPKDLVAGTGSIN